MRELNAESVAPDDYSCCPFRSTPGKFIGQWTNCIHGLLGKQNELLRELAKIEDAIVRWQMDHPRSGARIDGEVSADVVG